VPTSRSVPARPRAPAAAPDAGVVAGWLERLYVGAPGAGLRREDRRKAVEVAAMLREIARLWPRARARGQAMIQPRGWAGRQPGAPAVLVDAAAGKGYVGLLAARLVLAEAGAAPGRVVTIEREAARAATTAAVARQLALEGAVEVRAGDVAEAALWPEAPQLVAALHACGPAADVVIDRAIAARARALLLCPCCTSAAVPAAAAGELAAAALGVPRQAPVRRRFLQAFVDAERTLRLEAAGYETEVVELCPPTVTPHNLLWRARRVNEPVRVAEAARTRARLLSAGGPPPPAASPAPGRR
jgi:hypothetical protein